MSTGTVVQNTLSKHPSTFTEWFPSNC